MTDKTTILSNLNDNTIFHALKWAEAKGEIVVPAKMSGWIISTSDMVRYEEDEDLHYRVPGPFDKSWWDDKAIWNPPASRITTHSSPNPYPPVLKVLTEEEREEFDAIGIIISYHTLDPNASPKPSWDKVTDIFVRWWLAGAAQRAPISSSLRSARDAVIEAGEMDADPLHVGEGLVHMPALIQIGANTLAGEIPRRVAMRRARDHEPVEFWTHRDLVAFIGGVAERTNEAESARNLIRKRAEALKAIVADENGGLDPAASIAEKLAARTAAHTSLEALIEPETLPATLASEVAKLRDTLPADLPTLKLVLAERIEAAATGHQKRLKGALSQQAIDNWAACVDQDRALQEVSKECTLAVIEIERVQEEDVAWKKVSGAWLKKTANLPDAYEHEGDTGPAVALGADGEWYREKRGHAAATAAYTAGVKAIEAVTAANAPVWKVNDSSVPPGAYCCVSITDPTIRKLTVTAAHPTAAVEGNAVITDFTALDDDGKFVPGTKAAYSVPQDDSKAHMIWFEAPGTGPVTFKMRARNLCGPTELEVKLTGSG